LYVSERSVVATCVAYVKSERMMGKPGRTAGWVRAERGAALSFRAILLRAFLWSVGIHAHSGRVEAMAAGIFLVAAGFLRARRGVICFLAALRLASPETMMRSSLAPCFDYQRLFGGAWIRRRKRGKVRCYRGVTQLTMGRQRLFGFIFGPDTEPSQSRFVTLHSGHRFAHAWVYPVRLLVVGLAHFES